MKTLITLTAIIFFSAIAGYSQDCPHLEGCVTISRTAAVQALKDSDTVKAQTVEIAAKDQAIKDLEKIIVDLKIELAKMSGDKTGAEQMIVRLTAILDIMIKQVRPKKVGFINLF
jgi:hypothetical protein